MNKIELLHRDLYYQDTLYQLNIWVTAYGRLCIGYRNALDVKHNPLFSVIVEHENRPHDIVEYCNGPSYEGIGNTRNLDDACDMLNDYINKHNDEFKIF